MEAINCMKFNEEKLTKLRRADEHFNEKYGESGSPTRIDFENKAFAWYYGVNTSAQKRVNKCRQYAVSFLNFLEGSGQ